MDIDLVLKIHDTLIESFGGSKGIRDIGGLEAALARPNATFDKVDLYPTPVDKAAAIFESLIINHPFIDGNKRIAYVLLRLSLLESGVDIQASADEKYEMVIAASTGKLRFEDLKTWITERMIANNTEQ